MTADTLRVNFVSPRIRELARQPFIRPGGQDFDMGYAVSVFDARELVNLEELANKHPGKPVRLGRSGYVPHDP